MVIWRTHVENVSDLGEEEARHLIDVERRVERALLRATGAERAILMKLGIVTPHLHVHIYPVASKLTRAEVQAIIDAKTREEVEADFAERVRAFISESVRNAP